MDPRGKGRKEALGLGKRTCPPGDVLLARGHKWQTSFFQCGC